MLKPLEMLLPFLLIPMMLAAPIVHATEHEPIIVRPIIDIDFGGIIDAITNLGVDVTGEISSVPDTTRGLFTDWVDGSIIEFNDPILAMSFLFLTTNPNPDVLFNWWQSIVLIISSFYLLLFLIIGFMFLYYSINYEKRAVAKEWLKNAFLMIIAVNVSFWLYKLILELSTAITQYMWIDGFGAIFQNPVSIEAGTLVLLFNSFGVGLAAITLFIRYVFLMLGVMLFPIAIFLFYIPPLKNWGLIIFNLLGVALSMQFIDTVILIATNQLAVDLAGQPGEAIVPALSFLLIGIINVLMIVFATLKAVFGAIENSNVLGMAVGALTGQIGSLVNALKPTQNSGGKT